MTKITTIRNKLSELKKLKEDRWDLEYKLNHVEEPIFKEELIENKRKEYESYTDKKLGITSIRYKEPTKLEFINLI